LKETSIKENQEGSVWTLCKNGRGTNQLKEMSVDRAEWKIMEWSSAAANPSDVNKTKFLKSRPRPPEVNKGT